MMRRTTRMDWAVYLITDRRSAGARSLPDIVRAAIAGGVTAVQLREKEASTREMIEMGRVLRR